ncbi:hypothetical protein GDO78_017750 [Eleutherodactylus coqui]|uniref:Uncharacterized protein n=1 Tax=Eleutherodactylus coqui TaxID=57060 RepID=A0A8J6JV49_ELECQ|nr:hypothetical protein GDO78_017750 [Eleutherodactylus coqui]
MYPNQIRQGAQTIYIPVHGLEGAPLSVTAKLAVSRPCSPPANPLFFCLSLSPVLSLLPSHCGSASYRALFNTPSPSLLSKLL